MAKTPKPRARRKPKAKPASVNVQQAALDALDTVTEIKPWMRIPDDAVFRAGLRSRNMIPNAFRIPKPPPGVVPEGAKLAMDSSPVIEANAWAANSVYNAAFVNGTTFLGYPYLSELSQVPEYRRISEVLATEMTRKWIKLRSRTKGDDSKTATILAITAEMTRMDVQGVFRKLVELDGFFGIAHLYIDTGDGENRDELKLPIGNGRNELSKLKFAGRKGFLRGIKAIEPLWCYPNEYDSINPLSSNWYNPQSWFVQAIETHVSRLLTFVGRDVPDLLKPAYLFGGLSMSQMAKPYIDNWLRTRQAIADLIWSFSVRGLKTNMAASMGTGGDQLFKRLALWAKFQTNQGLFVMDKDTEDFFNVATPLGTLNELQAQAQEHICSVTGIPVVILLGIQPAGLNASSEGELSAWYAWVEAFQEKFFTEKLGRVIDFIQLSLFGQVDPDITFDYVSLRPMSEKDKADLQKVKMDTHSTGVQAGIIDPEEARESLAADEDSFYDGLVPNDVPQQPGAAGDPLAQPGGPSALSGMPGVPPRDPQKEQDRQDRGDDPARQERGREDGGEPRRDDDPRPAGDRTERLARPDGGRSTRQLDQAA